MGYDLHLFRPKPGAALAPSPMALIERGRDIEALDRRAIGDFLLGLGPALRFGAETALGDQYLYEDEQGYSLEIIVAERDVAVGFMEEQDGARAEQVLRVAYAISLAIVARFGLVLYDPRRGRFVRAKRAAGDR